MITTITVALPEELHWKVKQKCKIQNLTIQEVTANLLEEYIKQDFTIKEEVVNQQSYNSSDPKGIVDRIPHSEIQRLKKLVEIDPNILQNKSRRF